MAMPTLIRESLLTVGTGLLPGDLADAECRGAKHHSPRPLLLHEVVACDGTTVMLCGTCQDNLATARHLMVAHPGTLPWPLRRELGNAIRALAGV